MNLRMTEEQEEAHKKRLESARLVIGTASAREEPKPKKPRVRRYFDLKIPESKVLAECIKILEAHPMIAFWWRQNTGAARLKGNFFVKFSFKGASDLMAVTRQGRFCAIECKATGKKPSADQERFLANVREAKGLSACVDDPAKLKAFLDSEA